MTRARPAWLLAAACVAAGARPAAAQVTITRGPYVQSVSSTQATLRWRTSVACGSRVDFGPGPGLYTASVTDTTLVTDHAVTLAGLLPKHIVSYAVGKPDQLLTPPDASYGFRTAPTPGASGSVRVWVVGDSGHDNPGSEGVRDRFEAWAAGHPPDLWLMLGDNAYDAGTDADYQAGCFDLYPLEFRRWPMYPTRGNHDDLYAGPENDYLELFTMPALGEAGGG